jgi:hypothetical protein
MADPTVAAFTPINIFAMIRDLVNHGCPLLSNAGAPTSGTSGTFVGQAGPGALLIDYTNSNLYINTNTLASPTWTLVGGASLATLPLASAHLLVGSAGAVATDRAITGDVTIGNTGVTAIGANKVTSGQIAIGVIQVATGQITSANITGTSAGQLGHANGVVLVAAAPAGAINELISAVFAMDFATAAYTGGGNTTVNISGGGAALTGLATAAQLITKASDGIVELVPLAATTNLYTAANGLALVSASAPTQPGTAAGVINWAVAYRQIAALLD